MRPSWQKLFLGVPLASPSPTTSPVRQLVSAVRAGMNRSHRRQVSRRSQPVLCQEWQTQRFILARVRGEQAPQASLFAERVWVVFPYVPAAHWPESAFFRL
jgi:hypothetical protein